MSTKQFPTDLKITTENFISSGWQEVIKVIDKPSYSTYWTSFSKSAGEALDAGNPTKGKVLWLLADLCSLMLKPKSQHEPFQPFTIIQGNQSIIADAFNQSDLEFFKSILSEIDDFRIKARIADVLWLVEKPRKVQYALTAIDAYQLFSLNPENIYYDGLEVWHRAINLTLILKNSAGDRIQTIYNSIFSKFHDAKFSDKYYALKLSELLEKMDSDDDKSKEIAEKLESFALEARKVQDFHCSREYYEEAIKWYKQLSNNPEINRLIVQIAESFVLEAEQRISGDNPSNLTAGHFYECAIKTYRKIPKKDRAVYKVEERLTDIHSRMTACNKLGLTEMKVFETPGQNISKNIEASRNYVLGKNFPEVLLAFVNIYSGANVDQIRKNTIQNMQHSIVRQLFASTHMTKDGRVAARTSGLNFNDLESPDNLLTIMYEMMNKYGCDIGVIVQGTILPALQVINAEHRVSETSIFSLCQDSSIVPIGREEVWSKGLYFGFEYEFIISTHLLIPQIEHLVRITMKEKNIRTTTLDDKGIETENGLSALLENIAIEKVLDKNLVFELKTVLTNSRGSNLRNDVAHGLIEPSGARSIFAIYFWWLCLRLLINSLPWNPIDTTQGVEV